MKLEWCQHSQGRWKGQEWRRVECAPQKVSLKDLDYGDDHNNNDGDNEPPNWKYLMMKMMKMMRMTMLMMLMMTMIIGILAEGAHRQCCWNDLMTTVMIMMIESVYND